MQVLSQTFETKYSRYTQLERQGTVALFRRVTKATGKVSHEVVVITIRPAHTTPDGWDVDDQEVYPQDEAMDNSLWRYDAEYDARNQMHRVLLRTAATAQAGLQEHAGESGPPEAAERVRRSD